MKRELLVALGGTALVIAGLSGCSSSGSTDTADDTTGAETSAPSASVDTGDVTANSGDGTAHLTIDGNERPVKGPVTCVDVAGTVTLTVGQGLSGAIATLTTGDTLSVSGVALGNVGGVSLAYSPNVPGGHAEATENDGTYTITGEATGVDGATPVTKPFELEVSCR